MNTTRIRLSEDERKLRSCPDFVEKRLVGFNLFKGRTIEVFLDHTPNPRPDKLCPAFKWTMTPECFYELTGIRAEPRACPYVCEHEVDVD